MERYRRFMYLYYIDIFKALSHKLNLMKTSNFTEAYNTLGCAFSVYFFTESLTRLKGSKEIHMNIQISPFAMTTCVTLFFLLNVFRAISRLWGFVRIKKTFAQRISICDITICYGIALVFLLNYFETICQPLSFPRIPKKLLCEAV